jgi:hypothetical protein
MKAERSFILADDVVAIKARHSMVNLLQERGITVKSSGIHFKAPCPFHEETTPSFTIYPDNHGYCFGCGTSVDVIGLIQKLDGIGFHEACVKLGARTYADTPNRHSRAKPTTVNTHQQESDLRRRANKSKEWILDSFGWDQVDMWAESPTRFDYPVNEEESRIFLATLFEADDVVWVGDIHDSNRLGSERHFRTVKEWLAADQLAGPRTCPATFRGGERCRRNDRTLSRPYIVIEADNAIGRTPKTDKEKDLNRAANAALIRWCRDGLGMELVAIVDTGHKSLHAWFKRPSQRCIEELTEIAPVLGIDTLLATPAQPVRLPGFIHEKSQRKSCLLWLADRSHIR